MHIAKTIPPAIFSVAVSHFKCERKNTHFSSSTKKLMPKCEKMVFNEFMNQSQAKSVTQCLGVKGNGEYYKKVNFIDESYWWLSLMQH